MKRNSDSVVRLGIRAVGIALFFAGLGSAEAANHWLVLINGHFQGTAVTSNKLSGMAEPTIVADTAPAGQEFDRWSPEDDRYLDGFRNSTTRFNMPGDYGWTATAIYVAEGMRTFYLEAERSASDGNYAHGASVIVVANAPASGKVFNKWNVEHGATVDAFADRYQATTTFVMPNNDAHIKATYKNAPEPHTLTIYYDGLADTERMPGEVVTINALPPASGKVFDEWEMYDGADASMFGSLYLATTTFTMPDNDVEIGATYKDIPLRYLHVINSDSDANCYAGTVRTIVIRPSPGKVLGYWRIDSGATTNMFGSVYQSPTTFTMPDNDVQITGIYTNMPSTNYVLTVISGSGSGTYTNGIATTITANAAPTNQIFSRWTWGAGVDAGMFGNINAASTTFVMPAADVTVTATYATVYSLVVNSGSGDGTYTNAARVNIAADPPDAGEVFDTWTGAAASRFVNVRASGTIFTMSNSSITITATYSNGLPTTTTTTIPSALEKTYALVSVGTSRGEGRVVTVTGMRRKTWAQYALWSDYNGTIYFKAGEKFYGLVHSNSKLWFSGDPEFFAKVSQSTNSSGGSYGYGGSTNNCIFHDGYQTNAPVGSMASVVFSNMMMKADLVVTGTTAITLNGTNMFITSAAMGWTNYSYGLSESTLVAIHTAGSTNGDVSVGGQLDGRLTIVAERDINITNHLTYAVDPATNATCDDALGLIANRDIIVTTVAPNNLKVYAHMMATGNATPGIDTDGSFGVENYTSRSPSGQLTVWGGIVQNERGAVGTFSGTTLVSGFDKNYRYDTRFAVDPPPEYPPLLDQLTFDKWRDQ